MAGRFVDVEIQSGRAEAVPLAQHSVGRRARQRHAKRRRQIQLGIGEFGCVARADDQRAFRPAPLESSVAGDVVAVAVRAQNRGRGQRVLVEVIENGVRLQARIDDDAIVPPGKMGDIGILLERRRNDAPHG